MSGENTNEFAMETSQAVSPLVSPRRRRRPLGCATMLFLVGLALLVGGVYRMSQWDQLQNPENTQAVMLVVLGGLLLLPFVVSVVAAIVLIILLRNLAKSIKPAAQQIAQVARILVGRNIAPGGKTTFDGGKCGGGDDRLPPP